MFSERLKVLRKNKGLTQREFSEKIGVTEQAVSKWERGKSYPSLDIVYSIFNILDCSPNDLFSYNTGEKSFQVSNLFLNDALEAGVRPDILKIEIGQKLIDLFTDDKKGGMEAFKKLRIDISSKYGIILPAIRLRDVKYLDDYTYSISIRSKEITRNKIYPDYKLCKDLQAREGDIKGVDPLDGSEVVWTKKNHDHLMSPVQVIMSHFESIILDKFDQIINLQYVQNVVDIVNKNNPVIKQYIVPERVSLQYLKKVFSILVVEKKCRINEMVYIIETIDEYYDEKDIQAIVTLLSDRLDHFK